MTWIHISNIALRDAWDGVETRRPRWQDIPWCSEIDQQWPQQFVGDFWAHLWSLGLSGNLNSVVKARATVASWMAATMTWQPLCSADAPIKPQWGLDAERLVMDSTHLRNRDACCHCSTVKRWSSQDNPVGKIKFQISDRERDDDTTRETAYVQAQAMG